MTTFEGHAGERLRIMPGELRRSGRATDFRLSSLRGCTVSLCALADATAAACGADCAPSRRLDVLSALHVEDLKDCTVYAGCVAGSVLLHRCTNCTFVIGARQVRARAPH